jgi:hypothetical protein
MVDLGHALLRRRAARAEQEEHRGDDRSASHG